MPDPHSTTLSLRVFGDDLDPQAVTAALAREATSAWRKGDKRPIGRRELIATTGGWLLHAGRCAPGDLSGQIETLLASLTSELSVWTDLTARYRCDLFCGVFVASGNAGLGLTPALMSLVAVRGLTLSVDIYAVGECQAPPQDGQS